MPREGKPDSVLGKFQMASRRSYIPTYMYNYMQVPVTWTSVATGDEWTSLCKQTCRQGKRLLLLEYLNTIYSISSCNCTRQ